MHLCNIVVINMFELNLYQLKVFYSVARRLSYSRAGEELALSQPAVSRQVAGLEKSLGLDLFVRRGHRILLTDPGRCLFEYADRIFDLASEAQRAVTQYKDLERGRILLGTCSVVAAHILPPLLHDFQQLHPHIEISLQTGNSNRVAQMMAGGELDLALTGCPACPPGLQCEPFLREEMVLITSPGHPLTGKNDPLPADLAGQTLIWRERGSATRNAVEQYLARHGIKPGRVMEIPDTETIKRLVAANHGVAFVSRRAVSLEASAGMLALVPGPAMRIPGEIYLVSTKFKHHIPPVLALVNYLYKCQPPPDENID